MRKEIRDKEKSGELQGKFDQKLQKRMTNKEYSETKTFIAACEKVKTVMGIDCKATTRQAGKYRRKTGLAYKVEKGLTPQTVK
jgi:hypothetical protein